MNSDLSQDLDVNLDDDLSDDSKFPILPTLMTLGNAICGLAAIGLATKAIGVRLAARITSLLDGNLYLLKSIARQRCMPR